MLVKVERDKTLEQSNKEYKISLKDMFPRLMAISDDTKRKACILFLDVEMNPFFLMEKDIKFAKVSDFLSISAETCQNIYASLGKKGNYENVTREYIAYQNIPEYLLYRTCKNQIEKLCYTVDMTTDDELSDTDNKAFERSINFGKNFIDYYGNLEIAREKISKHLNSELHGYIIEENNVSLISRTEELMTAKRQQIHED